MEKIFKYTGGQGSFKIWGVGDMHIASQAFDIRTFQREIKEKIQDDPQSWWIGMGDYGECINMKDPRFDPQQIRERYRQNLHRMAQEEAQECIELLSPIKDKCLGLLNGNHEEALRRYSEFDLTWALCNSMDVPNLQDTVLYKLRFNGSNRHGRLVILFATHGYGGARKWGGKINKLMDMASGIRADIYMMGHQHSGAWVTERDLSMSMRTLNLAVRPRIGILTASFYRAYQKDVDTYASRKMYSPAMIGLVGVEIKMRRFRNGDCIYSLSPLGEIT